MKIEILKYETPHLEIIEVETEQGFAVSNPESIPYGDQW